MNRFMQRFNTATEKTKLLCFPFAGGYSASYRPLHAFLREDCDMLAADPPGHGTNRMPLVADMERLVDLYSDELLSALGRPFVLFGHSMGGLVVYRMAQKLERRGIFPRAVVISAARPPHIKGKAVAHLEDDDLIEYVVGLGGIPSELANDREALQFFLPAFRADFKAIESFEHADRTLLQSPVHIFNGTQDASCAPYASGWQKWAQRIRFHTFPGGHLFLLFETAMVAEAIRHVLALETGADRKAVTLS